MFRLDKYLTVLSIGSRSQARELIKKGKIKVNGQIVKEPHRHIDENRDSVEVCGEELRYQRFFYYMMNKPPGVLSAVTDENCRTVLDIMDVTPKKGLFPVGRLDKDTEGLLLITNDGELSHNLLSPSKHVSKKYYVVLDGALTDSDVELFANGLNIGEKKPTKPAVLKIIDDERDSAYITITEGRYHQVKRMFKTIGLTVTYLKRVSMGPLKLDRTLEPGQYRELSDREIEQLKNERDNNK